MHVLSMSIPLRYYFKESDLPGFLAPCGMVNDGNVNPFFRLILWSHDYTEHRKALVKYVQPSAALCHHPEELDAARGLLQRLLDTPARFQAHLRQSVTLSSVYLTPDVEPRSMTGTSILSKVYGIDGTEAAKHIEIAEKSMHAFACAGNSGAYLVDSLPL
jgi:hypothetical protein